MKCEHCGTDLGTEEEIKRREGNGAKMRVHYDGGIYCYKCWREWVVPVKKLFQKMKHEVDKFEARGGRNLKKKKRKK